MKTPQNDNKVVAQIAVLGETGGHLGFWPFAGFWWMPGHTRWFKAILKGINRLSDPQNMEVETTNT